MTLFSRNSKVEKLKIVYFVLLLGTLSFAGQTYFQPILGKSSQLGDFGDGLTLVYGEVDNEGIVYFTIQNNIDMTTGNGKKQAMIDSIFFATTGEEFILSNPTVYDADNGGDSGVDYFLKKALNDLSNSAVSSVYLFDSAKGNSYGPLSSNSLLTGLDLSLSAAGNPVDFNNADDDARVEKDESISFSFTAEGTSDILTAINNRNLIVGLNLKVWPGSLSGTYINETVILAGPPQATPAIVPVPGAAFLALAGVGMLTIRRKKSA